MNCRRRPFFFAFFFSLSAASIKEQSKKNTTPPQAKATITVSDAVAMGYLEIGMQRSQLPVADQLQRVPASDTNTSYRKSGWFSKCIEDNFPMVLICQIAIIPVASSIPSVRHD